MVGSDELYTILSDAYQAFLSKLYFTLPDERSVFLHFSALLLANITVTGILSLPFIPFSNILVDSEVEKILKKPNLCELGVNAIFREVNREAAATFIGNISYEGTLLFFTFFTLLYSLSCFIEERTNVQV